jgi:hypothetical protein
MLDKEISELKTKLAAIAARPPHWSETKIGRWNGGLVGDALRFQEADNWWTRDPRGVRDLSAVNQLLENCGLGRLRSRDESFERERDRNKKQNEKYESRTSPGEVADDAEEYESYMPSPHDNLSQWYADLPKHVDINQEGRKSWFSALGSYIGKFPATATLDDVDRETVAKLVKQICGGGTHQ